MFVNPDLAAALQKKAKKTQDDVNEYLPEGYDREAESYYRASFGGFFDIMVARLVLNDHKGRDQWFSDEFAELYDLLFAKVVKLSSCEDEAERQAICADIANYAAMILDNQG